MYNFTIELKPSAKKPLYEQIYEHIAEEIRGGRLEENERVPSKKALAAHLGVSVNTVGTAYEILAQEGYLEAVPRSGFYARHADAPPPRGGAAEEDEEEPPREKSAADFKTSGADVGSFPYATWIKLVKEVMYGGPELLGAGDVRGDRELRAAIAKYLREFRGVSCSPSQIIVGAGMEYLLMLVCSLSSPDRTFAIENPGYKKIDLIIKNSGRRVSYVPLDGKGISPAGLEKSGADTVYITPSHQFPTGVIMPMDRRAELLRWAAAREGRYIIEDDISGEFNFLRRPMTAVQGISGSENVIYMNTFSRVLAPSIRIAYMVLPKKLLGLFNAKFSDYSSTVPRFEQRALARFISEDYLSRHLSRLRNAYRKRRDLLAAAFKESPYPVEISGGRAGLHLLIKSPDAEEILKKAAEGGVRLYRLDDYYFTPPEKPTNTLVAGYAGSGEEDIARLKAALAENSTHTDKIPEFRECRGQGPLFRHV